MPAIKERILVEFALFLTRPRVPCQDGNYPSAGSPFMYQVLSQKLEESLERTCIRLA